MARPWHKALAFAVSSALLASGFIAISVAPSQATTLPPEEPSCLVINALDELIDASLCSGDLVIPARVKKIKAGVITTGSAISFEANSQLSTIEQYGLTFGEAAPPSIVFPASITQIGDAAAYLEGIRVVYLDFSPSLVRSSTFTGANYTVYQPRGAALVGLSGISTRRPYQIDCNELSGDRDFLAVQSVVLELHNCKDPRNLNAADVPESFGFVLNRGLNETATLEAQDGSRRATVSLVKVPGYDGTRLATSQLITGGGFSAGVFGAGWANPAGTQMSCTQAGGATLPLGVELTPDCKIQASDTTQLSSSYTDIVVRWRASPGVANSVEVAGGNELPIRDSDVEGTVAVRVNLMKSSELSPLEICQRRINVATYTGGTEDWLLAADSFNSLSSAEKALAPANPGIVAAAAIDRYENGSETWDGVNSAIGAFESVAASNSTFLNTLRTRQKVQQVQDLLEAYRNTGSAPDVVRREILSLAPSSNKTSFLNTFLEIAALKGAARKISNQNETRIEFANPYLVQHFTVPAGVSELTIELVGAQGSAGASLDVARSQPTGYVGRVTGKLMVSAGDQLQIGVGEMGAPAPLGCQFGLRYDPTDQRIARGGSNPFGGYGGGNGGWPSSDECATFGGAGGAATVVKILNLSGSRAETVLVAAGSAGSAGSYAAEGPGGSSVVIENPAFGQTHGQSAQGFWLPWELLGQEYPSIGSGAAGGGGGAQGGAAGTMQRNAWCFEWCVSAASSGTNSTAGLPELTGGYLPFTYSYGPSANGRVIISYVTPPVVAPPVLPPSPTSTPTPSRSPSKTAPDAPDNIVAVPFWKAAEVSWSAPTRDGGAPVTGYEVTASTGQICHTEKLSCRLTSLRPGQLIQLSVRAKNSIGYSEPATLDGRKVFIPLSANLWQVRTNSGQPVPKLLNRRQLATLGAMLKQDSSGFVLTIRLAKNSTKLGSAALKLLLAAQTKALKSQLGSAGYLGKVTIQSSIQPPNTRAAKPSFILLITKP